MSPPRGCLPGAPGHGACRESGPRPGWDQPQVPRKVRASPSDRALSACTCPSLIDLVGERRSAPKAWESAVVSVGRRRHRELHDPATSGLPESCAGSGGSCRGLKAPPPGVQRVWPGRPSCTSGDHLNVAESPGLRRCGRLLPANGVIPPPLSPPPRAGLGARFGDLRDASSDTRGGRCLRVTRSVLALGFVGFSLSAEASIPLMSVGAVSAGSSGAMRGRWR